MELQVTSQVYRYLVHTLSHAGIKISAFVKPITKVHIIPFRASRNCIFVNCICLACIVVILCVFVYLICICCTLCVFVVLCVHCCSYFRCRTAGQKSVSGRSCDRPPRRRFFSFSLCLQANAQTVPQFPSCYYMPLMQPSRLKFPSYIFFHICVHVK